MVLDFNIGLVIADPSGTGRPSMWLIHASVLPRGSSSCPHFAERKNQKTREDGRSIEVRGSGARIQQCWHLGNGFRSGNIELLGKYKGMEV